jgi:4-hydroxyphenylacetate 3-monooxygenase
MSSMQALRTDIGRPLRTGAQYLNSLRDGRAVFVNGDRVKDVTQHPAFREAARSVARLYDIAADPANRELMTFTSPTTGAPVLRAFQIPRTHADLRARRLFSEKWAESTFGLMGRSPDHVSGFFTGYAAVPSVFAAGGQKYADNVVSFYEKMRDEHLYLSYAIVPPQIDRSKPAHKQSDPTLHAGVVKERDDGIVIKGAQQVATGGVLSDWIQLSCIHPMQPGDENYANCVAIPVNAPGVKLYPRRPYALKADNSFDYPLSSRFDESDSYVVFDDVLVPWEHVFIYRNIEITRDQWFKTPSHAYGNHQAQVRYVTKLRFMMGLAQRMIEMIGTSGNPQVQVAMGELAALASIYEGMLLAHETNAPIREGVLWPSVITLNAAMAMQSEFNGRMLETVRELVSSSVISLPSSVADFDNPEIAPFLERYMRSGSMDARSRTALVRMLWDFLGTEFGSRHQQYEKFYGGSSFLVKQNVYRNYDFKRATGLVDAALKLPPVA